jgi:DNA-binding response OmpR family regulator
LKPAWANSLRSYLEKPYYIIELVERLKVKILSSSPSTTKKKKKKKTTKNPPKKDHAQQERPIR